MYGIPGHEWIKSATLTFLILKKMKNVIFLPVFLLFGQILGAQCTPGEAVKAELVKE
jgi:hypothetical protein